MGLGGDLFQETRLAIGESEIVSVFLPRDLHSPVTPHGGGHQYYILTCSKYTQCHTQYATWVELQINVCYIIILSKAPFKCASCLQCMPLGNMGGWGK